MFVQSIDSTNIEDIQSFMDESMKGMSFHDVLVTLNIYNVHVHVSILDYTFLCI